MKISNNKCHILIETSTDELEKNGLNIHSILTICEYPSLDYLNSLLKDNLYGNINDLYISSIYFSNGNWIIDLDLKNEFKIKEKNNTNIKNIKNMKIIKNFTKSTHRIYKSKVESMKIKKIHMLYSYLNKSIYSKYISIKNGIIFIKDKSKEKYILNFLSEYE